LDERLVGLADLLLPFRDSHEDIRTVMQDLELFSDAYLIPSQSPHNALQLGAATRWIDLLLADQRGRILLRVTAMSSRKLLLQE
jgi:chromosome partitioning protein